MSLTVATAANDQIAVLEDEVKHLKSHLLHKETLLNVRPQKMLKLTCQVCFEDDRNV